MHLTLSTSLALLLLAAGVSLGGKRLLVFDNFMDETIWVGSQGIDGKPAINDGGWEMKPHSRMKLRVENNWRGRFWGRTKCDADGECETGSCGGMKCEGRRGEPPVTLVELALYGPSKQDVYSINLTDGFNIKATIAPLGAQGPQELFCVPARCTVDINAHCPEELQKVVDGRLVGCNSACAAFNTDQYCCRGDFNSSLACEPGEWPKNYAKEVFRSQCDAYSYGYDILSGVYVCEDQGFRIKFG